MRASEIMDRFAQDTLKLHHELALEHKSVELNKTRQMALAALMVVLVVCMFFVMKSMRSGKRLEESKRRVLQLKLEGRETAYRPTSCLMCLTTRYCMPIRPRRTS